MTLTKQERIDGMDKAMRQGKRDHSVARTEIQLRRQLVRSI